MSISSLADQEAEADLPAVVLALGAQIHTQGVSRALAADDLVVGPSRTSLARGELITGITLPAPAKRSGSATRRLSIQ